MNMIFKVYAGNMYVGKLYVMNGDHTFSAFNSFTKCAFGIDECQARLSTYKRMQLRRLQ